MLGMTETNGNKPTARNAPKRQPSSESQLSLIEFVQTYPDDAACLDRLWRKRYAPDGHHARCPRCERERKFHRTTSRASYTCDTCGLHIHPMKGTIFEGSPSSLRALVLRRCTSWRALAVGSRPNSWSARSGVTYKTAHRMMKKIRTELMDDADEEPLSGDVEIDETSWGGKPRVKHDACPRALQWRERKPTVVGMVERGGRVRARVTSSRRGAPLSRAVLANVDPHVDASSPTIGRPTSRSPATSSTTRSSTTPMASTSAGRSTRTRSRASSGTSRPGCGAHTRRSRRATCSPTSTSIRGATTLATSRGRCSTSY